MNNAPLTFDFVVWTHLFDCLDRALGDQPWVAAARVNSIPALCRRQLEHRMHEARGCQRAYLPTLGAAESYLRGHFPHFFERSDAGWAEEKAPQPNPHGRRVTVDAAVWELVHEIIVYRYGVPPWVAADRLAAIRRSDKDGLIRVFADAPVAEQGRAAALRRFEEFLRPRPSDLLSPSAEGWA